MSHHSVYNDIIQRLTFYRFTIHRNQCLTHNLHKMVSPAERGQHGITTIYW